MSAERLWIPTKPYDLTDQINRAAAATGGRAPHVTEFGDYNGHRVGANFNEYRGYWIAEYFWGDRRVIARGDLLQVAAAAKRHYDKDGRGACVHLRLNGEVTAEQRESLAEMGYTEWSEEIEDAYDADWYTWKHREAGFALDLERRLGIPAAQILRKSESKEEFTDRWMNWRKA